MCLDSYQNKNHLPLSSFSCFDPETMLVIVIVTCGSHIGLRYVSIHICVHVIAFTAVPLHFHHDCNGSLQRCEFGRRAKRRRTSDLLTHITRHS